ncbi:N-acetylmuramate alpha-1-phosphate uridylyltransferase MurU [Congregibacter sp.]|uniref:N-acetylmuramate alpha-1-phosphate uridylyltransferase MurU n=1 Tax=Congregibacter sp. TaxID=2744308 RepID=UPI00385DC341
MTATNRQSLAPATLSATRAMLLAAGKGERMRPLTLDTPKPLLPVAGKPLIEYHIERLVAVGVRDIVINVSWLGEQIEAYCGDGSRWGCDLRYSREPEPLETAGGIIQALPLLGDNPFVLVNADIWTDFDFEKLLSMPLPKQAAHLVLVDNPEHNTAGDFSLEAGSVQLPSTKTLTYAGIGLYDPLFFKGFAPGKRALLPLLQRAIEESRLFAEHHLGHWTDVGTPERLEALEQRILASN